MNGTKLFFVIHHALCCTAHYREAAMRDLGLGCYKKKAANTHVPSVLLATLYALQMCKKVGL